MVTEEAKKGQFKVFSGPDMTGEAIMAWVKPNREEAEREKALPQGEPLTSSSLYLPPHVFAILILSLN